MRGRASGLLLVVVVVVGSRIRRDGAATRQGAKAKASLAARPRRQHAANAERGPRRPLWLGWAMVKGCSYDSVGG